MGFINIVKQENNRNIYDIDNIDIDVYKTRVKGLDELLTIEELSKILIFFANRRGYNSLSNIDEVNYLFDKQIEFGNTLLLENVEYIDRVTKEKVIVPFREIYIQLLNQQRTFEDGTGFDLEKMIGNCPFEPNELRCSKGAFTAEYANFLSNLNSIRLTNFGQSRNLTQDEKYRVYLCMFYSDKIKPMTYKDLRNILELDENIFFNITYYFKKNADITFKDYVKIEKNTVFVKMVNFAEFKRILSISEFPNEIEWETIDKIADILSKIKTDTNRINALKKVDIIREHENIISELIKLKCNGFARLSKKALKNIIPYLEKGQLYNEACYNAGYDFNKSDITVTKKYNPVSKEILNEILKNCNNNNVINDIINEFGQI